METDDGWRKIWAKLSDGELLDRLQYYEFLGTSSPLGAHKYSRVFVQLVAEADRRGKMEIVYEAVPRLKSREPIPAPLPKRHRG